MLFLFCSLQFRRREIPARPRSLFIVAFYWDQNDGTSAFAKRFAPQFKNNMPSMVRAGVYAAVLYYLQSRGGAQQQCRRQGGGRQDEGTADRRSLFSKGTIRADGRHVHDMYLFEVKKPAKSKAPWDYYKLRATIRAADPFRPLKDGGCPLVSR